MSESENEPQVGITGSMSRQPTLQTITWLLNLASMVSWISTLLTNAVACGA